MPLFDDANSPAGGATEALREFEQALDEATRALDGLGARAGEGGGVEGEGGGGVAIGRRRGAGGLGFRGLARLGGVAAVAAQADSFLSGAITTGSATAGLGNLNRDLISAAAKVPVLGALLGAGATNQTLGRSESRVGGGLADLARQGIQVTDEQIQGELDVVIAQERRATEVEARVRGISGSAENAAAAAPEALTAGLSRLSELVEQIAASVAGFAGGNPR